MLTDIFLNRYAGVTLWETFHEKDRRFLVQAFRMVNEQLYPYSVADGKEDRAAKAQWQMIHDKVSMELGLEELSSKTYIYNYTWAGQAMSQVRFYTVDFLCRNFVLSTYDNSVSADRFMKERMSFIEIAFRERAAELEAKTAKSRGDRVLKMFSDRQNQEFRVAIDELNARMRQARYQLHYHNGFIQRSLDPVVEDQIEEPFWDLMSDATWKNVDMDMKEAIDRRDNGDRDPAFYAARALESAIKIISDKSEWSHGGEKGAHSYVDNLSSQRAGHFIDCWEANALKDFFSHIRNPLGHGPGREKMPALSSEQTDWAIEFCMSWIKSLIRRI
jgi:AbiJ N-terminal domain 4